MGSNLAATQCHHSKRQYAPETFLAKCRVNDELRVRSHHLVEITYYLVHTHEKNCPISAEENFQKSRSSD